MKRKILSLICLVVAQLPLLAVQRFVPAGASVQEAIEAAQPGDVITLQAGATYPGWVILRKKPVVGKKASQRWITIRSSRMDMLPAGLRVRPSDSIYMAKLMAVQQIPVVNTEKGTAYYRLEGLEIASAPGLYTYSAIALGSAAEPVIADLPSSIVLDRMYIHGDPVVGGKRGVSLNSGDTTITNCYISDYKSTWQDTQAIGGWNGPGPYLIENNHVEAAAEAIAFGGAVPSIRNLIPSNIRILRNYFFKPLSWKEGHPSYAGTKWMVKNHLEFKAGRQVQIEGNVFENVWAESQAGYALGLSTRTENGAVPWNVIEDVTFANNIVRGAGSAILLLGKDDYANDGAMRRIVVRNNLFEDINAQKWGGAGRLWAILNAAEDVTFSHNTGFQTGDFAAFGSLPSTNVSILDNIAPQNEFGIIGGGYSPGIPVLDVFAQGYSVRGNVIAGGVPSRYPAGNYFPASLATVYFNNLVAGDYTLASSSPYVRLATDGTDPGANMSALRSATAKSVTGR